MFAGGDKVVDMEHEVVFPFYKRLVVPYPVEEPEVMTWWRLAKRTDLSVLNQQFNYFPISGYFLKNQES